MPCTCNYFEEGSATEPGAVLAGLASQVAPGCSVTRSSTCVFLPLAVQLQIHSVTVLGGCCGSTQVLMLVNQRMFKETSA